MELEQHVAMVRKKGGMVLAVGDRLIQNQRCPDHVDSGRKLTRGMIPREDPLRRVTGTPHRKSMRGRKQRL